MRSSSSAMAPAQSWWTMSLVRRLVLAACVQDLGALDLLVELEFLAALGGAFVDGVAESLLPAPRLICGHPV